MKEMGQGRKIFLVVAFVVAAIAITALIEFSHLTLINTRNDELSRKLDSRFQYNRSAGLFYPLFGTRSKSGIQKGKRMAGAANFQLALNSLSIYSDLIVLRPMSNLTKASNIHRVPN